MAFYRAAPPTPSRRQWGWTADVRNQQSTQGGTRGSCCRVFVVGWKEDSCNWVLAHIRRQHQWLLAPRKRVFWTPQSLHVCLTVLCYWHKRIGCRVERRGVEDTWCPGEAGMVGAALCVHACMMGSSWVVGNSTVHTDPWTDLVCAGCSSQNTWCGQQGVQLEFMLTLMKSSWAGDLGKYPVA